MDFPEIHGETLEKTALFREIRVQKRSLDGLKKHSLKGAGK
jgi:hypothetical protein